MAVAEPEPIADAVSKATAPRRRLPPTSSPPLLKPRPRRTTTAEAETAAHRTPADAVRARCGRDCLGRGGHRAEPAETGEEA